MTLAVVLVLGEAPPGIVNAAVAGVDDEPTFDLYLYKVSPAKRAGVGKRSGKDAVAVERRSVTCPQRIGRGFSRAARPEDKQRHRHDE